MSRAVSFVKDSLISILSTELKNFNYQSSKTQFIREGQNGDIYVFKLLFTKWSSHITLTQFAYVVKKAVEKPYADILISKWRDAWTIGSELGEIDNSIDGKIQTNVAYTLSLNGENKLEDVAAIICERFVHIAEPFYRHYTDLSVIDKLYNEPPYETVPVLVQRTLADRCMKGLIVNGIVKSRERSELVNIYDPIIASLKDKGTSKKYNQLKKTLGFE